MRGYNRYKLALDLFGVLTLYALYIYWTQPDTIVLIAGTDAQSGMLANILSELIGIWISVRLIDFFISRNTSRTRVRVRTVRMMRAIERAVENILLFRNGYEVVRLRRELVWLDSIHQTREKHLSGDEVAEVRFFYGKVRAFCSLIPEFETMFHRDPISLSDDEKASLLFLEIEQARHAAEQNILEETDEDSGMS